MRELVVLAVLAAAMVLGQGRKVTDEEVMRVHRSVLLIDTHNDVTSKTVDGFDIGVASNKGHTDIPRMKAGGIGAQFFAAYVASSYTAGNHSANRTLQMIDTVRHDIIDRYPADFEFTTTADGILAARKKGKIAALMGIEGGHAIEDSLRLLRDYYALGVRYMTLTHTNHNGWAESSGPDPLPAGRKPGLTDFGREVVREMNRLGMMVDVSHVSDQTFRDALEASAAPIFASHSSCRALSNVPRNMTDDMIRAMAKKGGLIQINFSCTFLSQKSADALAEWRRKKPGVAAAVLPATLADVVAQIDHVVKIAGVEAVGIGSDFDGVGCVPKGLEDVSKFPNLTRALLEKGYSEGDIGKIYGGNLIRVMKAVEAVATKH